MPPDHVHFNGSVNLADAGSVMREIATRVPSGLRRIPDGETGERGNWVFFQFEKFLEQPWLIPARPLPGADAGYDQLPQLRLADGADLAQVSWPNLGYAEAYLSEIPHGEVAVQWDVAAEFFVLEQLSAPDSAQAFEAITAALAAGIDQVPADIPAGLHLCYGDYLHEHFKQPASLDLHVRVLNAVTSAAGRPVSFVSFTVPQYQREESYFAPLAQLAVDQGTELNFALVPYHPSAQTPGTTEAQVRLIDAALTASLGGHPGWGICTECGMGRASREDIPALLDLHHQIVAAGQQS